MKQQRIVEAARSTLVQEGLAGCAMERGGRLRHEPVLC